MKVLFGLAKQLTYTTLRLVFCLVLVLLAMPSLAASGAQAGAGECREAGRHVLLNKREIATGVNPMREGVIALGGNEDIYNGIRVGLDVATMLTPGGGGKAQAARGALGFVAGHADDAARVAATHTDDAARVATNATGAGARAGNAAADAGTATRSGAGVGNPVATAGRGSSGRTEPNNLFEQMTMHEVQSNPLDNATHVPLNMGDPMWPASEGWTKMQNVVTGSNGQRTVVHFNYNEVMGAFDDFKFV